MNRITIAFALALALVLTATNAGATQVDITAATTQLSIGDSYYVGYILPDVSADPVAEADYITYLTTVAVGGSTLYGGRTYSRVNSTVVQLPTLTSSYSGALIPDIYTYVLAKYDGAKGGALIWVVKGFDVVNPAGEWTVPGGKTYSVNQVTFFTAVAAVPDGGGTLMLLGGALLGLAAVRLRFGA